MKASIFNVVFNAVTNVVTIITMIVVMIVIIIVITTLLSDNVPWLNSCIDQEKHTLMYDKINN